MRPLLALPVHGRRPLQQVSVAAAADGLRSALDGTAADRGGSGPATAWIAVDEDAVTEAQERVRSVLTAWDVDADTVTDADVLTAELVADLMRRTRSRCVGIDVAATAHRVVVTVREHRFRDLDLDRQRAARAGRLGPAAIADGVGVRTLDALAAEWGVSRRHRSTSVWFALEPAGPLPLAAVDPATHAQLAVLEAELHRTGMVLRMVGDLAAASDAAAVAAVVARALRDHLGAAVVDVVCAAPGAAPVAASRRGDGVAGPARGGCVVPLHGTGLAGSGDDGTAGGGGVAAVVPLAADGRELGALAVRWADGTVPDGPTRELLSTVAGYAARALLRLEV